MWRALVLGLLLATQAHAQEGGDVEVPQELKLTNVQLAIKGADGQTELSNKGRYPAKLLSSPQFAAQHTLEVSFRVTMGDKYASPQQALLALQHAATGLTAYVIAKSKSSTYTATIDAAAIEKQIGKRGGEYTVYLIVGDSTAPKGISWDMGRLELVLPGEETQASFRSSKAQPATIVKPLISHIFRSPDKRPPAVVSLAFTGLALVPLVLVVGYVLFGINANFKGWPMDATTSMYALLFHGGIGAMLALYLIFWLQWNLAETLPVALVLGLATALVGHKALSGIATSRLKKD